MIGMESRKSGSVGGQRLEVLENLASPRLDDDEKTRRLELGNLALPRLIRDEVSDGDGAVALDRLSIVQNDSTGTDSIRVVDNDQKFFIVGSPLPGKQSPGVVIVLGGKRSPGTSMEDGTVDDGREEVVELGNRLINCFDRRASQLHLKAVLQAILLSFVVKSHTRHCHRDHKRGISTLGRSEKGGGSRLIVVLNKVSSLTYNDKPRMEREKGRGSKKGSVSKALETK